MYSLFQGKHGAKVWIKAETAKKNSEKFVWTKRIWYFYATKLCKIMEKIDFSQFTDSEFRSALIATLNLKKEWMASVDKLEKELGLR